MQKVAWPMTIVQKLNGRPSSPMAERKAMPLTIPGNARGSTSRKEMVSRPKNFERYTAPAASDPRMVATSVARPATSRDRLSASQTSDRPQATPNHRSVSPGSGKRNVASSVVKAYRRMTAIGTYRKSRTANVPSSRPSGVRRRPVLEGFEGTQPPRSHQVQSHDDHGDNREGGRQWDVPRRPLQGKNRLSDEVGRIPQRVGDDEIPQ